MSDKHLACCKHNPSMRANFIAHGEAFVNQREEAMAYIALCGSRQPPRRGICANAILYTSALLARILLQDGLVQAIVLMCPLVALLYLTATPHLFSTAVVLGHIIYSFWLHYCSANVHSSYVALAQVLLNLRASHSRHGIVDLHRLTARVIFVHSSLPMQAEALSPASSTTHTQHKEEQCVEKV